MVLVPKVRWGGSPRGRKSKTPCHKHVYRQGQLSQPFCYN